MIRIFLLKTISGYIFLKHFKNFENYSYVIKEKIYLCTTREINIFNIVLFFLSPNLFIYFFRSSLYLQSNRLCCLIMQIRTLILWGSLGLEDFVVYFT